MQKNAFNYKSAQVSLQLRPLTTVMHQTYYSRPLAAVMHQTYCSRCVQKTISAHVILYKSHVQVFEWLELRPKNYWCVGDFDGPYCGSALASALILEVLLLLHTYPQRASASQLEPL